MRISNGKWCWWSHGIGGSTALDYLIKVRDMPFLTAAHHLADVFHGRSVSAVSVRQPAHEQVRKLQLPPKNATHGRVEAYLKKRGIAPEVIDHCIQSGSLYESADYHNAVFVGFDRSGVPRYGFKRSTGATRFVADCAGSSKQYAFCMDGGSGEDVHLFESAIDALSFATLLLLHRRDWRAENLLSLSGIYTPKDGKLPAALAQYLVDHPGIRSLTLHLDNDAPGRIAAQAIATIAKKQGLRCEDCCPKHKDVNEDLCLFRGLGLPPKSRPPGRGR